ncbi:bifunctional 4-hydroxy-2-oxoglutarate aldolase/2-dehydro-3-deoxy-phosphogluconate aldolase [Arthrobacter alpinus]|nr:bifunctional 4-hydroxy-2-oxoglutarate aldolase/2-dehydro-3-deoxy-phosphogluconate aldolase [Arthrobacter alpinus]
MGCRDQIRGDSHPNSIGFGLSASRGSRRARAGFPVGAGTIVTAEHVVRALDCGAAFAVSPGTDRLIMEACRKAGLPQLPGVATASDIQVAISMGASWVKAFPASVLGPAWLKAMAGPFPTMNFVATGASTPTMRLRSSRPGRRLSRWDQL